MGINEAPLCSDDDCDEPSKEETATFDTACQERYHLHDKLGQGISSTVRRVVEKATHKEYAVKIIDISGEKTSDAAAIEQTKSDTIREVNILRMCAGHPNIIELHDYFETPTFLFLVFELCRKGELFDDLTREVQYSEKRTRLFMHQLFQVVWYLHNRDIVHRDLKPENILLDDNHNIKVSDFGFATILQDGEKLTELLGTPGYLAPETLNAAMDETNTMGYGKEVDLWACGVIMFTLLCGSPPFWHRKQMYMLRDIMAGNYAFSSPIWNDVSDTPKDLIRHLLVVDPNERYTAKQALLHPFFQRDMQSQKTFDAKKVFRAAAFAIRFFFRLRHFHLHPPPVSMETLLENPYKVKLYRKLIDGCAFGMYSHWVKRGENQNRAAMFEHTLRDDWKQNPVADGNAQEIRVVN